MELVVGNHLGMVVNTNDPENRGRVQVFIPHLSTTLFKDWNNRENLSDIQFRNTTELASLGVLNKLKQILPWAEAAVPIFGGATSVTSNSSSGNIAVNNTNPTFTGFSGGGTVSSTESDTIANSTALLTSDGNAEQPLSLSYGGTINTSNMNPVFKNQYERVYSALEGTKFANMSEGEAPKDGAKYGIDKGTREEWAHFFTRLAKVESTFNPNRRDGNTSFGLYQMGKTQFNDFFPNGDINNPNDNTKSFVKYAESMYFGVGKYRQYGGRDRIAFKDKSLPRGFGGISAGFGPLQRSIDGNFKTRNEESVLGVNMASTESASYKDYLSGANTTVASTDQSEDSQAAPKIVKNDAINATSALSIGKDAYTSAKGSPNGTFSIPNESAKVWVFFHGGDIQRPVYFASIVESA
jgi:hypothetical protein